VEIRSLAARYAFNPRFQSARGTLGSIEGRETGASVEIQDFRDYVPGDDPRHIDWMAYGRTDRLMIRLYREEVSPFVDLLVDGSASMGLEDGRKSALARELCSYIYHSAKGRGSAVRVFEAADQCRRIETPGELRWEAERSVLFSAPRDAAAGMRRSAVRIVVSDFMDPADPAQMLRVLSEGCAHLLVLQLLGPWEADPDAEGPAVLERRETGRRIDIQLDSRRISAYRRRLEALVTVVREETTRCHGLYLRLVADRTLEQVLRDEFLPLDLVQV
jgi:uncharacterized protein (DUF58 family)